MRALIRKDMLLLLLFLVGGVVSLASMAAHLGSANAYAYPDDRFVAHMFYVWWPLALGFGLVAGTWDELLGTEAYLRHRPLPLLTIVGARLIACGLVLVAWIVIPMFAVLLLARSSYELDAAVFLSNLLQGSVVFPCFAVGFFAASFAGHWVVRLFLGASIGVPLFRWFDESTRGYHDLTTAAGSLGLHLLITAALLYGAWRCIRIGRDRDLPLPTGAVWPVALAALSLLWIGDRNMTELFRDRDTSMRYPRVASVDGDIRLVRGVWNPDTRRMDYSSVDDQHGEIAPARNAKPLQERRADRLPYPSPIGIDRWVESGSWTQKLNHCTYRTYPHHPVGTMRHFLRLGWAPRAVAHHTLVLDRNGEPFSERSRLLRADWRSTDSTSVVGDPADGGVWLCDFDDNPPSYRRLALPDGDRFVHWLNNIDYRSDDELFALVGASRDDPRVIYFLRGEKAVYLYRPGARAVEPLTAEMTELVDSMQPRSAPTLTLIDRDVINPVVEVRDAEGTLLFEHRFSPHTWRELTIATLLYSQSFLRAPVVQATSFLASRRDTVVTNFHHPWLLLFNLLLGIGVAWHAGRRLRRMDASAGRARIWVISIALGGVLVYLVHRMVETERAHRSFPTLSSDEQEQHQPLIRSA